MTDTVELWVSIDQVECTGSGMCELSVPEVFTLDDAGLAIVRSDAGATTGAHGTAVPVEFHERVREAAAACPGGCIRCHETRSQ
jgi:ferredoxin